jgi:hypothetical protein
VDRLQLFQVDSILRPSRKTLEADDAGQGGDPHQLALPFNRVGPFGDRGEVKGRRTAAKDVDDSSPAVHAQVLYAGHVLDRERFPIEQSPRFCQFEEAQDRVVGILAVGDE